MIKENKIIRFSDLFSKSNRITKTVNFITLYRIIAAPMLIILLFAGNYILFKWLLLLSFFTDAIDGFLARKYKGESILGSKLDSLGDDLTILVALVGVFKLRYSFIKEQLFIIIILFSLFFIQLIFSLIKYRKISSFHTYGAKVSAILQAIFLVSLFFFEEPIYLLFYFASLTTIVELTEEIILVAILPNWEIDVKGLYWVLRKKKTNKL